MAMTATPGTAATRPPRLLLVLTGLYLAQTIPAALFVNAIPPILRQEGVTRTALGALGLLALPGVLKFLWAPLVDRLRPFARAHRAGWIALTQAGVILAVLALLLIRPGDLLGFIPIAFAIAMLLSTQDVATDGYATLALPPGRRAAGNAVQSGAAAAGVVLGGSFGLLLYHQFGWSTMVLGIAGLCLLPLAAVPAMREGRPAEAGPAPAARPRIMAFLQRPEARRILWIALLFRASEGLVRPMEAPYLVDARVGLDTIALLTGAAAAVAGLAGTVLLAWLLQRRGPAVGGPDRHAAGAGLPGLRAARHRPAVRDAAAVRRRGDAVADPLFRAGGAVQPVHGRGLAQPAGHRLHHPGLRPVRGLFAGVGAVRNAGGHLRLRLAVQPGDGPVRGRAGRIAGPAPRTGPGGEGVSRSATPKPRLCGAGLCVRSRRREVGYGFLAAPGCGSDRVASEPPSSPVLK
ncbi:MAG: MFS transporter [Inquilinus sp.]|uniref:MFS transporter n=1 Tax=Inquilinus sp. TaxID=1932117 RepID=UPI003F39C75D